MDKKISIVSESKENYELFWRGFCIEAYAWVTENQDKAHWISGRSGNCLYVLKDNCSEIVSILIAKGYVCESNLGEVVSKSKEKKSSNFVPRDYQTADAVLMLKKKKFINASEMGTGKTCTAIMAAYYTQDKVLVVCPSSVKYCWAAEIEKICPWEKYLVYNGETTFDGIRWLIMSYDQLRNLPSNFSYKQRCVILDEAHYIKNVDNYGNPGSKRAKKAIEVCRESEYAFLLTGTPMPSFTKDIYNLARAVDAHDITFYDDFRKFGAKYCNPYKATFHGNTVTLYNGSSNQKELNGLLSNYMVRRKRAEVLPHLKKYRQNVPVHIRKIPGVKIPEVKRLQDIMMARKVIARAKAEYTIDFVNNLILQGEKVVIVSCFLDTIEYFSSNIKESVKVTGDMSSTERMKAVQMFQSGDAMAIALSITAGGVGITLTASSTIVFNDFDFVPANLLQAEDRICRIGQRNDMCNVFYMVADDTAMDNITAEIIERKMKNINEVIDKGDITDELLFRLSQGKVGRSSEDIDSK